MVNVEANKPRESEKGEREQERDPEAKDKREKQSVPTHKERKCLMRQGLGSLIYPRPSTGACSTQLTLIRPDLPVHWQGAA